MYYEFLGHIWFLTASFIWWFVYWIRFSTLKDDFIANITSLKIFRRLRFFDTLPILCFWVNQLYMSFKSLQYIFQFISLDFYIIPGGLPYLPGGKILPSSNPGKFFKIWHFSQGAGKSPPGCWDRVSLLFGTFACAEKMLWEGQSIPQKSKPRTQ